MCAAFLESAQLITWNEKIWARDNQERTNYNYMVDAVFTVIGLATELENE